MADRHSFEELQSRMSPGARAKAEAEALRLREEIGLVDLRRALRLSQEELAQTLHVGQAAIAKLEKCTDMYVSTLRRFIEAMGGELEVVAKFPKHSVRIRHFGELKMREPA
jgi:ribosome-binding protein aMBF1 (putative translation factor)